MVAAGLAARKVSGYKGAQPQGGTMPARQPPSRLPDIPERERNPDQRALIEAIQSGPRGRTTIQGPFAVFQHAPKYGQLAQALGAHCRLGTSVPPRLSELAILLTAHHWRAQFEWFAHAPIAERAGVKAATVRAIRAGRTPKSLPKDEQAVYDFFRELYRTRRVSERTYKRVQGILGDAATVELTGILGYYALVAMTLNVFRMPVPAGEPLPFPERNR
jgi:4-carboxymuconolactone decarboxylase